jgi:hypothetical protein
MINAVPPLHNWSSYNLSAHRDRQGTERRIRKREEGRKQRGGTEMKRRQGTERAWNSEKKHI